MHVGYVGFDVPRLIASPRSPSTSTCYVSPWTYAMPKTDNFSFLASKNQSWNLPSEGHWLTPLLGVSSFSFLSAQYLQASSV